MLAVPLLQFGRGRDLESSSPTSSSESPGTSRGAAQERKAETCFVGEEPRRCEAKGRKRPERQEATGRRQTQIKGEEKKKKTPPNHEPNKTQL